MRCLSVWSIVLCHFQRPWTTPTPSFKVTTFFKTESLRNGTRYRHSFNGILTNNDLNTPYSTVSFQTLSDLANNNNNNNNRISIPPLVVTSEAVAEMIYSNLFKYSMMRSIAWPLCDRWASCKGYYDICEDIFFVRSKSHLTRHPLKLHKKVLSWTLCTLLYNFNNNKNLAIANRSRVSCAHSTSMASPWPWNLGSGSLKVTGKRTIG